MAKEKKTTIEQNQKELTFYYEIIGIICLIIPVLGLARLGTLGYYIMMSFRIAFGDWYFAILLALVLYGLRCLLYHKPLRLKNMRTIGVILILIGILTISHFPMHNYVSRFGNNYVKLTFQLYIDYFKNYQDGMIVGGGVIGGCFFYLCYSLFASVGTVIITICLLFVGIAFTLQKTISEFIGMIGHFLLKIIYFVKRFFHSMKYDIKKNTSEGTKIVKKTIAKAVIRKLSLDDITVPVSEKYIIVEEKHAQNLKKTIGSILNNMNIFYKDIACEISLHVTSFLIDTIASISMDALYMKLKRTIEDDFLLTKDLTCGKIVIQVKNLYSETAHFKTLLLRQGEYKNNLLLPIGIATDNTVLIVNMISDQRVIIVGDDDSHVNQFLIALICMLCYKYPSASGNFLIFDLLQTISSVNMINGYYNYLDESFLKLQKTIDERIEIINNANTNNIDEYNKLNTEKMMKYFVIINGLEKLMTNNQALEQLCYLLQVGKIAGFYFIIHLSKDINISNQLDNLFDVRIFGRGEFAITSKYLGITPVRHLAPDEGFLQKKDIVKRVSLAMITNDNITAFQKGFKS